MAFYIRNTPAAIDYEIGNDDIPPEVDNTNRRLCLEALARLFEQGSGKEETSCMSCEPSRPICSTAGEVRALCSTPARVLSGSSSCLRAHIVMWQTDPCRHHFRRLLRRCPARS